MLFDPLLLCPAAVAGEACLKDLSTAPLQFVHQSSSAHHVHVVNATDAALMEQLSALGRAWLRYTYTLAEKTITYTVPKLFLFELLPSVDMALTLDADVVALADVTRLFRWASQVSHANPSVALMHAAEQQNRYRWSLNWSRVETDWPAERGYNGVNGGVGIQLLNRLRHSSEYRDVLARMLHGEMDRLFVGGGNERVNLKLLGDQIVFSAAAVLAPRTWANLTRALPCAWNWQTCVWSYQRANECPLIEGKATCANAEEARRPLHDSTCHTPPRLYVTLLTD